MYEIKQNNKIKGFNNWAVLNAKKNMFCNFIATIIIDAANPIVDSFNFTHKFESCIISTKFPLKLCVFNWHIMLIIDECINHDAVD